MPIIDMRTGKVLVTDKQLIKDLTKWLASITKEEWHKMLEERRNSGNKTFRADDEEKK